MPSPRPTPMNHQVIGGDCWGYGMVDMVSVVANVAIVVIRRGEVTPPYGNIHQYAISVGTVRHNAQTSCAALLCRALRRVNHLCSRTVSGTANRQKNGRTHWSAPTEEKILCRSPYFAAVTCRQSAPDYPRERGDSQEGGNRRCLPSCAPAGQASSVRFSSDTPPFRQELKKVSA